MIANTIQIIRSGEMQKIIVTISGTDPVIIKMLYNTRIAVTIIVAGTGV
jgi:hypothetical protein